VKLKILLIKLFLVNNMKIKLVSFLIILCVLWGCDKHNKSIVKINNDTLIYVNPSNNEKLIIYLDTKGNPILLETKSGLEITNSRVYFNTDLCVKDIDLYDNAKNIIKAYSFNRNHLIEAVEYALSYDSNYTINQSKYFNYNERVIEDEGFFVDVILDDTVEYMSKHDAVFEPKGVKFDNSYYFYSINEVRHLSKSRKLSVPLKTDVKGINKINGYISRIDSGFYDGEKVAVELKIRLQKEYFVK